MKKKIGKTSETTVSAHFDENESVIFNLMANLLTNAYPVVKFKEKKRWRRGIDVEGKRFLIPRDNHSAFQELFKVLKLYYDAEQHDITKLLNKYYNF
jgi:hypothetical protein